MLHKFIATKNDHNRKLFSYLKKILDNVPLNKIERLLRKKDIKINNIRTNNKHYLIQEGDCIFVYNTTFEKKKIEYSFRKDFSIIYEDANVLIVNKEPHVMMHGDPNSLDSQVYYYLKVKEKNMGSFLPSHIGRLDAATSGIVVYGKNYSTVKTLKKNQKTYITKKYAFKSDLQNSQCCKTTITPLFHKMICGQKVGKECITEFWVLDKQQIAILKTGRKHQIRATLELLNCPIWGDKKYGGKKASRLHLHHHEIQFNNIKESFLKYLNEKTFQTELPWKV